MLLSFLVEWIQLLMFLLDPVWRWNINFNNTFWRWLSRFQASPLEALSFLLYKPRGARL